MLRRALLLGHTGYIGGRLFAALRRRRPDMDVLGHSLGSVDLTREEQVASLAAMCNCETVLILCSGIKKQYGDTLEHFQQNVAMAVNVARLVSEHPVGRLIFFSSAEVYGEGVHNTAIMEETPVQATTYYGLAKFVSEGVLRKAITDATSLAVLRPPLVYGPGEQGSYYGPGGFVRGAYRGDPITLWGEGDELREFLYVDDLVNITIRLMSVEWSGVVNIASGDSRTFRELLDLIAAEATLPVSIATRPRTKPKVDQRFVGSLIRRLMPEVRFTSLEDGVRKVFAAEPSVTVGR